MNKTTTHELASLRPDVTRRDITVLSGVVLLATVPFLDKAFHIDDHYYLQVARHIVEDPWRPYEFQWVAEGHVVDVFDYDWSPPLFKYVLALGLLGFGEREVPLHAIMSLFTACAAGSMYALALRFSPRPLLATVLVILNPLFVPSQNLMLDVPMLAFGLAGIACHVWGTDRRSLPTVLVGGLLTGLAIVTKYPALILLPLVALYSCFKKSWLGVPALGAAVVPFAAWCVQNLAVHGRLHFVEPVLGGPDVRWADYAGRFLSVLTILGSGFVPLLFVGQTSLSPRARWGTVLFCLILSAARQGLRRDVIWIQLAEHLLFLAGGLYLLVAGIATGLKQPRGSNCADRAFLLAWLLVGWFASLGSPFVAVRHVLWALPAAALVVTRLILAPRTGRDFSQAVGWLVAASGLCVGWADKEYAGIARQQVHVIARNFASSPWKVYYLGEDGFAYYCATAGISPLLESIDEPFAYVVCPASTSWSLPAPVKRTLVEYRSCVDHGTSPIVTLAHGVNFYRTGTADLPWGVGEAAHVYLDILVKDPFAGDAP